MTRGWWWFWLVVWSIVVWTLIILGIKETYADDRCNSSQTVHNIAVDAPRYAAMAGIQMDLNVNSLQVGGAISDGGKAVAIGKRLCLRVNQCGFFGLNLGMDSNGDSYTLSTTWVIK